MDMHTYVKLVENVYFNANHVAPLTAPKPGSELLLTAFFLITTHIKWSNVMEWCCNIFTFFGFRYYIQGGVR